MTTPTKTEKNGSQQVIPWQTPPDVTPWGFRLGRLFDTVWPWPTTPGTGFPPDAELEETEDAFTVEVDLPGVDRDHVHVDVAGRRISIHGERTERERKGVLRHTTRVTGSFSYDFVLPATIDEATVTAKLTDGVLRVVLPKGQQAKATHIAIQ